MPVSGAHCFQFPISEAVESFSGVDVSELTQAGVKLLVTFFGKLPLAQLRLPFSIFSSLLSTASGQVALPCEDVPCGLTGLQDLLHLE